jgi:hypothetical protein
MRETRGQKRAAVDSLNPLYHADVLPRVLSYVGSKQWLFIGLVSRMWRAAYRKLLREEAQWPVKASNIDDDVGHSRCKKHKADCLTLTSRAQAFASATRVRAARAYGLQWTAEHRGASRWDNPDYDRITGKLSSFAALKAAFELGMPLHADLADGVAQAHSVAAEAGDLVTLQWLKTQGAVPDEAVDFTHVKTMPVLQFYLGCDAFVDDHFACCDAARSASLEVLQWCHAQEILLGRQRSWYRGSC